MQARMAGNCGANAGEAGGDLQRNCGKFAKSTREASNRGWTAACTTDVIRGGGCLREKARPDARRSRRALRRLQCGEAGGLRSAQVCGDEGISPSTECPDGLMAKWARSLCQRKYWVGEKRDSLLEHVCAVEPRIRRRREKICYVNCSCWERLLALPAPA
jgi:hypothetical protein